MSATTDKVESILRGTYPCGWVPFGAYQLIAEEAGCTREWVRQVAKAIGYTMPHQKARERQQVLASYGLQCRNCGERLPEGVTKRNEMCAECKWVTVACDGCETLFKKSRAAVLAQAQGPHYFGHSYCSDACLNVVLVVALKRPRPNAYRACTCGHYKTQHLRKCKHCACKAYTPNMEAPRQRLGEACAHGHPWTEANTGISRGVRYCKTCVKLNHQARTRGYA